MKSVSRAFPAESVGQDLVYRSSQNRHVDPVLPFSKRLRFGICQCLFCPGFVISEEMILLECGSNSNTALTSECH